MQARKWPHYEMFGLTDEDADRLRESDMAEAQNPSPSESTGGPWTATGQTPIAWLKSNAAIYEQDHAGIPRHAVADEDSWNGPLGYTYPGVYFLYLSGKLVYVGKSVNVNRRLCQHVWQEGKLFDAVAVLEVPELLLGFVERHYISTCRPSLNVHYKG